MIIRIISLMEWMKMIMTWLDRWMGLDWIIVILVLISHQVQVWEKGIAPFSLQLQNLGSVTAMHTVDRPRPHRVRFSGTWPKHCAPFSFTTASRPAKCSVDQGHREMLTWFLQVDRVRCAWGRSRTCVWGRPGQLWGPFLKGFCLPYLDDFRWNFGYLF